MLIPIEAIRIESEWNGNAVSARHWITIHLLERERCLEARISAPYYGDPAAPDSQQGPTDGLWEYEVVELFLYGAKNKYLEIELSPSGHHLVLRLDGVRQIVESKLPLPYEATILGDRWTATAKIDKNLLPPGPLRWNATAIHGSHEQRTYLSWVPLPGEKPDFHQPEASRPLPFSADDPAS